MVTSLMHLTHTDVKMMTLYLALFDEDGSATKVNAVYELIVQNKWTFNCDAVKYWYSENIDDACHGNYTAIYAWR